MVKQLRASLIVLVAALALFACGCAKGSGDWNGMPGQAPAVQNRSFDGAGNNLQNPVWGSAGSDAMRLLSAAYADGMAAPAGPGRPNPRTISNTVVAQPGLLPNPDGLTNFVWSWGQFIDHDIALTLPGTTEPMPVPVPLGDPFFDPMGTGTQEIPFMRSQYDPATGHQVGVPRLQVNSVTSFIDASGVYGSDPVRAQALRTFVDGRLRTSAGDYPPYNDQGLPNENPGGADPTTLFLAGDVRANEQPGLTSLHTIFLREHNRQADALRAAHPDWSDEQVYQRARKVVGALVQTITYEQFLPALLGPNPLGDYKGYDPGVDATIDLLFSTAGYRVGHTLVSPTFERLGPGGVPIPEGPLALRDAFFQPQRLTQEGGVDPIVRGLAATRQQTIDPMIIDDLRNFLFGPPGAGGFDLAALNIQRGRDHGLPDYNTIRSEMGFPRVTTFAEITVDAGRQAALAAAYPSVDEIDPWVGLLSEDPAPNSRLGPTLRAVWLEQFGRLRDGDRFFYLNDPALGDILPALRATRLSDVIRRNTGAKDIQDNLFFLP